MTFVPAPIIPNGTIYSNEASPDEVTHINNLSQINVFVGPNNSGKSKILRELLRHRNLKPIYISEVIRKNANSFIRDEFQELQTSLEQLVQTWEFSDITYENNKYLQGSFPSTVDKFLIGLDDDNNIFSQLEMHTFLAEKGFSLFYLTKGNNKFNHVPALEPTKSTLRHFFSAVSNHLEELVGESVEYFNSFSRVYIPTLRTLRTLKAKNVQSGSVTLRTITQQEYFQGIQHEVNIENGQDLYEKVLDMRTGEKKLRDKIDEFEKFLGQHFFNGQTVELIPRRHGVQELHIKIGDEKEKPIYDLGDGLQMLIILTFPLFEYRSGIVVIEEPELFVHPGLQRKLVEIYCSETRAKSFQFYIATHSNHILDQADISENASIFKVKKFFPTFGVNERYLPDEIDPDFIVENLSYRDQNALLSLGVSNSSVYLANCSIWVEGITDKIYLSKLLSLYLSEANKDLPDEHKVCRHFKEGIHYTFILSGGDNIVHYDFSDDILDNLLQSIPVKSLCGKALVVVDDDGAKNVKRKEALQRILGVDRFIIMPVVEIENLLSIDVIARTIICGYDVWNDDTLSTDDKIGRFSKAFNMSYQSSPATFGDASPVRIGTAIEDALKDCNAKGRKSRFADHKGSPKSDQYYTLLDKTDFAKKAAQHIQ